MAVVHNAAKRKLQQGDIALGFGLHHLRSSAAPMFAMAGQHDHLFMDMDHGAFTVQEATRFAWPPWRASHILCMHRTFSALQREVVSRAMARSH